MAKVRSSSCSMVLGVINQLDRLQRASRPGTPGPSYWNGAKRAALLAPIF